MAAMAASCRKRCEYRLGLEVWLDMGGGYWDVEREIPGLDEKRMAEPRQRPGHLPFVHSLKTQRATPVFQAVWQVN